MDHKELLKALGGEHEVFGRLSEKGVVAKPVTVRAWALGDRNIPAKYWAHIKEIADACDVPLTYAQLAESVRKPARAA